MPGENRQTFGRYEVIRPLGAGGMGEILLARQSDLPGLERYVVLKKVLPHLAADPEFLSRFLDETRVSLSLNHGNIVQVYEVGQVEGQYFMAMEYVEGMDLREVLQVLKARGQRVPEPIALYILNEVAKGLAYAHERKGNDGQPLRIVHRDVSPANLLLSADGQVKVTDFGVAKAASRLSVSLPGKLVGKVYYMSPEQVSGGLCDHRSDIFSLGVVAFEMLAGRRPFEGDSEVAVIESVRRCEPPDLAEAAPWVSPSLAAIIARALARDPNDRYQDMHEFQQAINAYMLQAHTLVSARGLAEFLATLQGQQASPKGQEAAKEPPLVMPEAHPAEAGQRTKTVTAPPQPVRAARKSRLGWWVAGAVLALAVAGFAIGLAHGPEPLPEVPVPATATDIFDASEETADLLTAPDDAPAVAQEVQVEPRRHVVSVRSIPDGAEVFHGERRLGTTPLEVTVPAGSSMKLQIRLDSYIPRTVVLSDKSSGTITTRLDRQPTGHVRFRFFPANATVFIDDRPVQTRTNVVRLELPEGEHVLRIQAGDRSRVERFRVQALETTELGSLEP